MLLNMISYIMNVIPKLFGAMYHLSLGDQSRTPFNTLRKIQHLNINLLLQ